MSVDVDALFDRVKNCIYKHDGSIYGDNGVMNIDINDLQVLDVYSLAENDGKSIRLAPKGRFFIRKNIANDRGISLKVAEV